MQTANCEFRLDGTSANIERFFGGLVEVEIPFAANQNLREFKMDLKKESLPQKT